jgi:hypothetical protein
MSHQGWRIEPMSPYICDGDDAGTLVVEPGTRLDALPAPYADLVTPEHRAAMDAPAQYFGQLATESRLPELGNWLRSLATADAWELHLSWIPPPDGGQEAGVRAYRNGEPLGFCVRLRTPGAWELFPDALRHVYSVVNGTYQEPFFAGGIFAHEDSPLSLDGHDLLPPVLLQDPAHLYQFYSNGTGDALLADGDRAVWFLHETNGTLDIGPLDEVVNAYFKSDLDGSSWPIHNFNPYKLWRDRNPGRRG